MHLFCSYGKWEDVGASGAGAIIAQEKRCSKCNKLKRRQTQWLGGFGKGPPIPSPSTPPQEPNAN